MKWTDVYETVKNYIKNNKDKLDGLTRREFAGRLALAFQLSPATIITSYLPALEQEGVVEETEYGVIKVKI